ncbi:unnamed protein product [Brugia timori]|uniref:Uncharacterized protein n=1 Tax=Brugia timori TaxID=42155 RepID=A0A0R3R630_9BILA|nr:unnamed protein product [Brugia timori]
MITKRNKKQNLEHFEYTKNTKEVKDEKTEILGSSKSGMKMVGEQSIGQSSAFAVLDSQYKSWRLIVRNLPFKVGFSNFSFSPVNFIISKFFCQLNFFF